MRVCMYLFMCVDLYTCIYVFVCLCVDLYACMYVFVYVCGFVCVYVCVCVYLYACMCLCVYLYACMFVCVWLFVCVDLYACMYGFVCMLLLMKTDAQTTELHLVATPDKKPKNTWKERNVLFNDALNTFDLRLYGVKHIVKDHSDSER